MALDRRLHQKRPEVQRKVPDGALGCQFRQISAQLALQTRSQKPVIAVGADCAEERHGGRSGDDDAAAERLHSCILVHLDADLQKALALAAVECEHLMALELCHRLAEFVIQAVDRVLVLCAARGQDGLLLHQCAQTLAKLCVVGDALGQNVSRARKRILRRLHALFRVDVFKSQHLRRLHTARLGENGVRQRLQPFFLCNGGARAALGAERAVDVLDLGKRRSGVNALCQRIGQLFLRGDELLHLRAARLQIAQVLQPRFKRAEHGIVHAAMRLLAVAGNEGNGVALVQKRGDVFHVFFRAAKLRGQNGSDVLHVILLLSDSFCIVAQNHV